ncbi:MAG: hypothetical protein Q9222_006671 [Ikaeria aurantiellina]
MRKEQLPYDHLLQHRRPTALAINGNEDKSQAIKDSTFDIFRPPESVSSKSSSTGLDSPPPEPDSPPSTKRRRLSSLRSQQIDLTLSSPEKKDAGSWVGSSSQLSDIHPTQFTTSQSLAQHSNGRGANTKLSSQDSKGSNGNHNQELFYDYYSSQSKAKRPYGKNKNTINFHKEEPAKKGKKRLKKESQKPASFVKEDPDGFKKPDKEAVDSAGVQVPTPKKRRVSEDFKTPAISSPNSRSNRAQTRAAKEKKDSDAPIHIATFKKPPQPPPSPPSMKQSSPPFVVPQGLPHTLNDRHSHQFDAVPGTTVTAQNLQTIKEIRGLADTVRGKLDVRLEAPTSSATIASGPMFDIDADDSTSLSSLSSAADGQDIVSPKMQCPICKDFVSRLFREEFSGSKHLSLRQQAQFCKAHKLRSAEEVWRERKYPGIEWHRFAERLPTYEPAVCEILKGTRRSFYRNMFEDQVKSGTNRTLQQSMMSGGGWEGLNVGYYGTKGARILYGSKYFLLPLSDAKLTACRRMDFTMSKFASRIRRLASTDKLVSAGGVSGFVQAVLAPELAVMLVKDDMNVDEEQARVILKESSEIGHLLNEEEDEVIKDMEEREATQM